jgi:hypothetical protein
LHLLEGKALYREIWDHKPPLVFTLNALALGLGEGDVGMIRTFERVFQAVAVSALFLTLQLAFRDRRLAFFGGILFLILFNHPLLLWGGNYTEEYGACFAAMGICAAVAVVRDGAKRRMRGLFLSGLCFSLATHCKEPFLFSSIAWFGYALIHSPRVAWGGAARSSFFVLGALVPFLLCAFVLYRHQAWQYWLDTVVYGFAYSKTLVENSWSYALNESQIQINRFLIQQTNTGKTLLVIGALSCLYRPFLVRYRYFPLAAAFALVFDALSTTLSDRFNNTYFLQCVPSFTLVAVSGLAFLMYGIEWVAFRWKLEKKARWVLPVLFTVFAVIDHAALSGFMRGLVPQEPPAPEDPILADLLTRKKVGDRLWLTSGHASHYHVETGMLSPSRHFASFDHHFIDTWLSTGAEKEKNLLAELKSRPPRFIIAGGEPNSQLVIWDTIGPWMLEEYEETGTSYREFELWERKARVSTSSSPAPLLPQGEGGSDTSATGDDEHSPLPEGEGI